MIAAVRKPEWRPVIGFEGLYEVSRCGQVRSILKAQILTQSVTCKKYLTVRMYRHGNVYQRSVAKIVAEAYIGRCPQKHILRQRDGNHSNCHADNLIFQRRAVVNRKIDEEKAAQIRNEASNRRRGDLSRIAKKHGLTLAAVSLIALGKRWLPSAPTPDGDLIERSRIDAARMIEFEGPLSVEQLASRLNISGAKVAQVLKHDAFVRYPYQWAKLYTLRGLQLKGA